MGMTPQEIDRIQNAINHIKTAVDVDPWAMEIAVEAMEKQIPKMPVEGYIFREGFRSLIAKKDQDMANKKGSCCPNCGEHVGESELILQKKNYMPFCKWCGQALKQPEGET